MDRYIFKEYSISKEKEKGRKASESSGDWRLENEKEANMCRMWAIG